MKFATVLPPHLLESLGGVVGDYHLVLAQYALEDKSYAEFYTQCCVEGHYIIMDNGVAEGARLSGDDLEKAFLRLMPHEIVAPDRLNDSESTWWLSKEFCDQTWVQRARARGVKLMVVPQGRSWHEWCSSYAQLLVHEPDSVGISKFDAHYMPFSGTKGRLAAVHHILTASTEYYQPAIHLLGLFANPIELALISTLVGQSVRGADSVLPVAAAYHEEELNAAFGTIDRPAHWDLQQVTGLSELGLRVAKANIKLCQAWAERGFTNYGA